MQIEDVELFIRLYDGEKKGFLDIHKYNNFKIKSI